MSLACFAAEPLCQQPGRLPLEQPVSGPADGADEAVAVAGCAQANKALGVCTPSRARLRLEDPHTAKATKHFADWLTEAGIPGRGNMHRPPPEHHQGRRMM